MSTTVAAAPQTRTRDGRKSANNKNQLRGKAHHEEAYVGDAWSCRANRGSRLGGGFADKESSSASPSLCLQLDGLLPRRQPWRPLGQQGDHWPVRRLPQRGWQQLGRRC